MIYVPRPRKLKSNELAIIEVTADLKGRKAWRPLCDDTAFLPGSEHDAFGVANVLQKQNHDLLYRISIFRRVK